MKDRQVPKATARKSPHRGAIPKKRGKGAILERGVMSDEESEFLRAINEYKVRNNRPFPAYTELLTIIKHLGYRRRRKTAADHVAASDVDGMREAVANRVMELRAVEGKLTEARCDLHTAEDDLRAMRARLLGVARDAVDTLEGVEQAVRVGDEVDLEDVKKVRKEIEKQVDAVTAPPKKPPGGTPRKDSAA
ncbi:MAG TPA: hypothetical protein VHR72_05485 [Gemmataceae bacterium]|nr:hypothetical protein [Gemmataceae bacterium]